MEHLFQIGFSITGFTAIVLFIKNEDNRPSTYAILLLSLWFLRFLALYLKDKVDLYDFPFLIVFDQTLLLLDGVLFYWYVRSLNNLQKLKTQIVQIIPFLIAFGLSIIILLSGETTELVDQYYEIYALRNAGEAEAIGADIVIFLSLVLLINGFFVYKSIGLLSKYRILLTNNFSNLLNLKISWLKKLTYFWLAFSFIPLVIFSISYIFRPIQFDFFELTFLLGLWATSVFFSINVITQQYSNETTLIKPSNTSSKNESDEEIDQIFTTLTEYMKKNEPFKDEKLTLQSLASQLDLKPAKLSVAINTKNGTNFHEYINRYRVEAVKKELNNTAEQIIIIAYRNGFNSKSTFNSAFKKMTGITPSQYRKASDPSK